VLVGLTFSPTVVDAYFCCKLFETEISRKVKREPALAMESMKMFPDPQDQELRSEIVDSRDIVGELWTFG